MEQNNPTQKRNMARNTVRKIIRDMRQTANANTKGKEHKFDRRNEKRLIESCIEMILTTKK